MIEAIIAFLACFGTGEAEDPKMASVEPQQIQIIRAIDSQELKGFENLQSHQAEEWFV